MNTLTALKRCALGLDLYLWITYRTFTLRAPLRLTWKQVYRQFGAHPAKASNNQTVQNFRIKAPGVLILSPSTPAIAPLNQGQLGR